MCSCREFLLKMRLEFVTSSAILSLPAWKSERSYHCIFRLITSPIPHKVRTLSLSLTGSVSIIAEISLLLLTHLADFITLNIL